MDGAGFLSCLDTCELFSQMGVEVQQDNVVWLRSLEEVLDEINEKAWRWLPSSADETDPFYAKIEVPKTLLSQRKQVSQMILKKTRNLEADLFVVGAHDFRQVARQMASFAFRQYLLEDALNLGRQWEQIVALYLAGHWPVAYQGETLLVI